MRSFLAVIILGWLCGTALGVWQIAQPITWCLGAGMIGMIIVYRYPLSVAVATSILLATGFLYGQGYALASHPTSCTPHPPVEATIISRLRQGPEAVQYRATTGQCLLLVTTSRFPLFSAGDKVKFIGGRLQAVEKLPDTLLGYRDYLQRQGVGATWRYPSTQFLASNASWQSQWWDRINNRIDQIFMEPEASLTKALLLADMGTVTPDIQKSFQATGVNHILSISGLHLSLIAGLMLSLFSFLPLSPGVRTLVVISILTAYVGFIGWPVAAIRALIFWVLVLLTTRLNLLASMISVLLMATALVITHNPLLWLDISWQLSCAAVLGIVVFSFLTKPYRHSRIRLVRLSISPLIVSLGATLATWPLIAYHFGIISFVSLLANLVIVPISTIVLVLAIMAVITSWICWPACFWLSYLVRISVMIMTKTALILSHVPGAYLDEVSILPRFIFLYYGALVFLGVFWLRRQKRSWREIWE